MLIGELEGEVSTSRLTFEAYKEVEQFDFVTVKNPKDGQEWILAQIDEVTKHPDGKTECEANVIGFRENGMLKQPRYVIEPDSMVYRADEDVIAETLGLTTDGLYMGRLDTNPDIRIFVNPEDLYKHIAVLAKTGAGKSYASGVLIEELLEKNVPVLIIDPHGEYHSLEHENDELSEDDITRYDVSKKGYPSTEYSTETAVNPAADPLSFSSRNMDAKEIEQLVPTNLTNSQLEVLYNALKSLKEKDAYDLQDVNDAAMSQDSKAKWNLVNILEVVQDANMFSDDPTPLDDLVRLGEATIINLKGVDPERQEMIVYKLAKELFERRKVGELEPFIMMIEEAHNFVPERNFGKAVSSDILRTIASEGRKFGLGIGVVSQRPARVDKNILSQCNTQLILRVTNPNDLNAISRSFEGVTSEVKEYITSLPPGTGLLLGKEYPVMTDIRTRRSKHGGGMNQLTADDTASETEQEAAEPTAADTEPAQTPTADAQEHGPGASSREPEDVDTVANTAEDQDDEHPEPAGESSEASAPAGDETDESVPPTADAKTALTPVMSKDDINADTVKTAYYPLWLVSSGDEAVAVDGTDGEVKDWDGDHAAAEKAVMDVLERGPHSMEELVEACTEAQDQVGEAVAALQQRGQVTVSGDQYRDTRRGIFDREREPIASGTHTIIETDITEKEAVSIAKKHLSGAPEQVEQVYYPYFTAGTRVFDAVRGKEV